MREREEWDGDAMERSGWVTRARRGRSREEWAVRAGAHASAPPAARRVGMKGNETGQAVGSIAMGAGSQWGGSASADLGTGTGRSTLQGAALGLNSRR